MANPIDDGPTNGLRAAAAIALVAAWGAAVVSLAVPWVASDGPEGPGRGSVLATGLGPHALALPVLLVATARVVGRVRDRGLGVVALALPALVLTLSVDAALDGATVDESHRLLAGPWLLAGAVVASVVALVLGTVARGRPWPAPGPPMLALGVATVVVAPLLPVAWVRPDGQRFASVVRGWHIGPPAAVIATAAVVLAVVLAVRPQSGRAPVVATVSAGAAGVVVAVDVATRSGPAEIGPGGWLLGAGLVALAIGAALGPASQAPDEVRPGGAGWTG